jgi:transposase
MNHVAVDLGSRKSQLCVRTPDGRVVREVKVRTRDLVDSPLFSSLEKSRVVLEACAEAFKVADAAVVAGHEVCIVPATLAPSLGVGQRGVKTDVRDAQNLSMASCRMEELPSVHLPSWKARDWRSMLTSRAALIATRTMLVNSVKGWARTQLLTIPSGGTSTFPKRIRDAALEQPSGLPEYIERTLKVLDEVNEQIAEADKELAIVSEADAIAQRLMSTPGVGPVTALSFRATVDDVSRFPNAHSLQSYLGLTPGESSSGMKTHRLGITSAGSVKMRTALVQAAWSAYRTRPNDPMVLWARKISERRPKQVAVVALARKMSGILFALWRDGTMYSVNSQHQA